MSHITPEARSRAAETKRQRTRDQLIHAADRVFEDKGLDTTIEDIAEEARVSVATFYNYADSRNDLCVSVFTELVVAVLEQTVFPAMPLHERIDALAGLVEGREALTRAALIGRLEEYKPGGFDKRGAPKLADFVQRLACVLWEQYGTDTPGIAPEHLTMLHAAALEILDRIVQGHSVDAGDMLSWLSG